MNKKTNPKSKQAQAAPEAAAQADVPVSQCPLCDVTRAELTKCIAERKTIQSAHDTLNKELHELRAQNEQLHNVRKTHERDLRSLDRFWEEAAESLGMDIPPAPPEPDPSLWYLHHNWKREPLRVSKSDVLVHVKILAGREKLLRSTIKQLKEQMAEQERSHAAQIEDLGKRYAAEV